MIKFSRIFYKLAGHVFNFNRFGKTSRAHDIGKRCISIVRSVKHAPPISHKHEKRARKRDSIHLRPPTNSPSPHRGKGVRG